MPLKNILLIYVYRYFACMRVYELHACPVPEEAGRGVSGPLELELQMVVNHQVGAEN